MTQGSCCLQAMDRYRHIVGVICRWILGLLARSRVNMDLKYMDLQALIVALMKSGILVQPHTVQVNKNFFGLLGLGANKSRSSPDSR